MRKLTFLTFLALVCSITTWAQIPNGGFESWTTIPKDNNLTHFRSDNNETPGLSKYQPGHGGSYAMKLTTYADPNNGNKPAGNPVFSAWGANPFEGNSGFAYTQKPSVLSIYAKYDIKPGDVASIVVVFKKNGVNISGGDYNNIFTISGSNPLSYQKLDFNINGLAETPDQVVFIFCSFDFNYMLTDGASGITPQIGSYIIIDDVEFDTSNPIPYMDFEEWGRPIVFPDGWMAQNAYEVVVSLDAINPITKSSDAHSGTSALLAKPYFNAYEESPNNPYVALITTGDYVNNSQNRFPCTIQHGSFSGYYKYLPSNAGERANISISFYKNGALVDYGLGVDITEATSTYTQFTVPFHLSVQPDEAYINIVSNTNVTSASIGTELYLDDLDIIANNNPISVTPAIVYQNSQNIDIIYYASLGNGALYNYTGDVYVHTGVVLTSSPNDWSHASTWGVNDLRFKCEKMGTNVYHFMIPNFKDYYGLLDGEVVSKIAFVFRNSEATKAGKDLGDADFAIDVLPSNSTSLITSNATSSLEVYPNPATSFIMIKGVDCLSKIEIADIQGNVLFTTTIANDEPIDISSLQSGLYLVKLTSANKVAQAKLLVK